MKILQMHIAGCCFTGLVVAEVLNSVEADLMPWPHNLNHRPQARDSEAFVNADSWTSRSRTVPSTLTERDSSATRDFAILRRGDSAKDNPNTRKGITGGKIGKTRFKEKKQQSPEKAASRPNRPLQSVWLTSQAGVGRLRAAAGQFTNLDLPQADRIDLLPPAQTMQYRPIPKKRPRDDPGPGVGTLSSGMANSAAEIRQSSHNKDKSTVGMAKSNDQVYSLVHLVQGSSAKVTVSKAGRPEKSVLTMRRSPTTGDVLDIHTYQRPVDKSRFKHKVELTGAGSFYQRVWPQSDKSSSDSSGKRSRSPNPHSGPTTSDSSAEYPFPSRKKLATDSTITARPAIAQQEAHQALQGLSRSPSPAISMQRSSLDSQELGRSKSQSGSPGWRVHSFESASPDTPSKANVHAIVDGPAHLIMETPHGRHQEFIPEPVDCKPVCRVASHPQRVKASVNLKDSASAYVSVQGDKSKMAIAPSLKDSEQSYLAKLDPATQETIQTKRPGRDEIAQLKGQTLEGEAFNEGSRIFAEARNLD